MEAEPVVVEASASVFLDEVRVKVSNDVNVLLVVFDDNCNGFVQVFSFV